MKNFLLTIGLSALLASPAFAHPYCPLKDGSISTLNYNFKIESSRKDLKQTEAHGTITITADGWEEREGHRVLRYITTYQGIPFMKGEVVTWRREENGAIYSGQEIDGKYHESLELPADVSVDAHWTYNDGVKSVRTVARHGDIRLADGEIRKDCIEITRAIPQTAGNEKFKGVSDLVVYCRDTGVARTLFTQPSPVGLYRTETILAGK